MAAARLPEPVCEDLAVKTAANQAAIASSQMNPGPPFQAHQVVVVVALWEVVAREAT
jgi:hypothetical protein